MKKQSFYENSLIDTIREIKEDRDDNKKYEDMHHHEIFMHGVDVPTNSPDFNHRLAFDVLLDRIEDKLKRIRLGSAVYGIDTFETIVDCLVYWPWDNYDVNRVYEIANKFEEKFEEVFKRKPVLSFLSRLKKIPKNIQQTQEEINKIKSLAKQLPNKKLSLKEDYFPNLANKSDDEKFKELKKKRTEFIYRYQYTTRDVMTDYLRNKLFDLIAARATKGKTFEVKKNASRFIYYAGCADAWRNFNYDKAREILKRGVGYYYDLSKENWPKSIKQSKEVLDKIKSNAKQLPNKKLSLKEDVGTGILDIEYIKRTIKNSSSFEVASFGSRLNIYKKTEQIKETYKEIFDELVRRIKEAENSHNRYNAMEALYSAGLKWNIFDYKKALEILKDGPEYLYTAALKNWPKGVEETSDKIKEIKIKAKELPSKKLKLKEENFLNGIKEIKKSKGIINELQSIS